MTTLLHCTKTCVGVEFRRGKPIREPIIVLAIFVILFFKDHVIIAHQLKLVVPV
jgi:hypothetical protein